MEKIEKVFDANSVPICFSANSEFIKYTAVMIQSIIDHSSSENNYDIIILHSRIENSYINSVEKMCEDVPYISIRFFDVTEYIESVDFFTKSVYTKTKYTTEAYYRLLIPELMPSYDKVLYFDGDMLALSDVAELYHSTDMTGYMLASSRDYAGISNCYIEGDDRLDYRKNTLGLKNTDNYIISGMLVFNIAEFNKRYTAAQLMEICASRNWRQHDQDVLNVICEDSLLLVDGAWDYLEDYGNMKYLPDWLYEEYVKTSENVKIVHYAGPRKPWKYNKAFMSDEFWDTCSRTPFFNSIFLSISKNYGYKNSIIAHLKNRKPRLSFTIGDAYVSNGDYFICKMSDIYTKIESLKYFDNKLSIEGFFNFVGLAENEKTEIFLSVDGRIHSCDILKRNCNEYRFNRLFYKGVPFSGTVKLNPNKKHIVKIVAKIKDSHYIVSENLRFNNSCPINELPGKYYYVRNVIITTNEKIITVQPSGLKKRIKFEKKYLKNIKQIKKRIARIIYFIRKKLIKKEIWLISDRYNMAGDNGQALFEYLKKNKIKNVKPCFAIDKSSPDFEKLKKTGKVVDINGWKYKYYRIVATKIISSHLDRLMNGYSNKVYSDINAGKTVVFLQHGIIKDDLSSTYNKYIQNMDLFITSAKPEYYSIVSNPQYGCGKNITKLTGLARYDKLVNNDQKLILIVPTWRRSCMYNEHGEFKLRNGFENSLYFDFYNRLVHDDRIIDVAKKYGYRLCFYQHPIMRCADGYFGKLDDVFVNPDDYSYSDIFSTGSLLITDYSSAQFDFAYLDKPVLYCQFDKDSFYKSHSYVEGYYDYERDGFGEVCYDYEHLVLLITEYLTNGCTVKEKYLDRINDFYAFKDRNNCKRIVDEILKVKK